MHPSGSADASLVTEVLMRQCFHQLDDDDDGFIRAADLLRALKLRDEGAFDWRSLDVGFSECNMSSSMCVNASSYVSAEGMMQSRGVFSVDGIGNEWTLLWKLLANSVCLLVESSRTWQWYYPHLVAWRHYVPVRFDMSDLAERVAYVLDPANDGALQAIARESTALAMAITMQSSAAEVRPHLEAAFNPKFAPCETPATCSCWAHKCAVAPGFYRRGRASARLRSR